MTNNNQENELKYFKKLLHYRVLDQEEEFYLAKQWNLYNDENALNKLIEAYLKLVVSQAFKLKHYGLPISDLIQEGILGLITAAKKFDPSIFEIRFSGYAKWWIKANMQDYIIKNWSIVRMNVSKSHKQLFFNLNRLKKQIFQIHNEYLSAEEAKQLSDLLKISTTDIFEMEKRLSSIDFSLSVSVGDNSNDTFETYIEDTSLTPEDACQNQDIFKQQIKFIQSSLDILTKDERYIIEQRYLNDMNNSDQIAENLKIPRKKIKIIENRAFRKMRFSLLQQKKLQKKDLYQTID